MKATVKFDKYGNVKSIKGNIGRTRMNRAALELWKGNVEPTSGYKLRRFFKRFFTALKTRAEAAHRYHNTPHAAAMPYIGLEDGLRELQ